MSTGDVTITKLTARRRDITLERDADYAIQFQCYDADTGDVVNLTGYTMTLEALSSPGADTPSLSVTPGTIDDVANGLVTFTIDRTDIDDEVSDYQETCWTYSMFGVDGGGDKTVFYKGDLRIIPTGVY